MKRIALATLIALTLTVAHADPMYISDKLVVNVYAEADQESSKVATLDSGDAVETIEKVDTYTHVRLPNDREGWIKSSYLTAQVPAIVRLKELEKERGATASSQTTAAAAQLSEELKQVKERNSQLTAELVTARQAAQSPAAASITVPQKAVVSEQKAFTPASSNQAMHPSWIAGIGLLCGAIGFALGYQVLARRIRKKYGSVRIY